MNHELRIEKEDVYLSDIEGTPWPKASKNGDEYLAVVPSSQPSASWNYDDLDPGSRLEGLLIRGVAVNLDEASERRRLVFLEDTSGLWLMSLDSSSIQSNQVTFYQLRGSKTSGGSD